MKEFFDFDAVEYDDNDRLLRVVDQTQLPHELTFINITDLEGLVDAIATLKVRGAPAIGIAGAIGAAVIMLRSDTEGHSDYLDYFKALSNKLIETRPTAVNLYNNLMRLEKIVVRECNNRSNLRSINSLLLQEALKIKAEDIEANLAMAERACSLLPKDPTILTYCNAGHMAVSRYGTALAPIYLAHSRGEKVKVYACETRPLLQGARITSFELQRAGVDVTLICDNMVAHLLSMGVVDAVITGCDRIAANGDVANKIGTHTLSICANRYNTPHYIIGPETTIDYGAATGNEIKIEERAANEITDFWYSKRMAPEGVKVFNPAFDITPSNLISAIITEKGLFRYPYNFKKNG